MAYNLPDIDNLNLTMDHVVGIYNGTYKRWNDSSIAAYNPYGTRPTWPIRVIVRADEAGSTEIFTSALSDHSPAWADTFGNFSIGLDEESDVPVNWDPDVVDLFGRTNRGLSGLILSYRGSIGYLSTADTSVTGLSYATLVDDDGTPYSLDTEDIERAVAGSKVHLGDRLTADLKKFLSPGDYPIISYSYLIVRRHMVLCDSAVALAR